MNNNTNAIKCQNMLVSGLNLLIFYNENEDFKIKKIVFFLHGLCGNMQDSFKYCKDLAKSGYIAITLDHRNHGARTVNILANQRKNPNYIPDTYGICTGMAIDLSHILDFLPEILNMEIQGVALMGFSLGAHSALIAGGLDSRVCKIVGFGGAVNRETMLGNRDKLRGMSNQDISEKTSEAMRKIYNKYDPIYNIDKYENCSILSIHGENDKIVDYSENQYFIEKLRQRTKHLSDFDFYLEKNAEHEITESMWQVGLKWLKEKF